jgi:nitroreductase
MKRLLAIAAVALLAATAFAQDISLGKPPATLGIDVLDAIKARSASRAFVQHDVPKADLAAILWAGNGLKTADAVSSASKAGATIAVSGDVDYVTVYVLTAKGVYRYEPASDLLKQLSKKDARADVTQENIPTAALMVLFAYDSAKLPSFFKGNPALGRDVAMGSAAFSAQNIQLVAAGLKLSSVVMYNLKPAAAAAAGLSKTESLLFLTQIGYTK